MKRNTTKRRRSADKMIVQMPRSEGQQDVLRAVQMDRGIVSAATDIEEPDKTIELGRRYAQTEFDLQYGEELAKAEANQEVVQLQYDDTKAALDDVNHKLALEPPLVPAPQANGGAHGPAETQREVPFRCWYMRDQFSGGLMVLQSSACFSRHTQGYMQHLPMRTCRSLMSSGTCHLCSQF